MTAATKTGLRVEEYTTPDTQCDEIVTSYIYRQGRRVSNCRRLARFKINGKCYCAEHAGKEVLAYAVTKRSI